MLNKIRPTSNYILNGISHRHFGLKLKGSLRNSNFTIRAIKNYPERQVGFGFILRIMPWTRAASPGGAIAISQVCMGGTAPLVIVTELKYPDDILIDFQSSKLYWTVAGENKVYWWHEVSSFSKKTNAGVTR